MRKISMTIDEDTYNMLQKYMKKNKLKNVSRTIAFLLRDALEAEKYLSNISLVDNKLNKILYRISMYKNLLEQMYVNFGFPKNKDVRSNELLKEFYYKNNKFWELKQYEIDL